MLKLTITFEALSFWLGMLSLVLGVGSIGLSIVFYLKSDSVLSHVKDILYDIGTYSKNTEYVTRGINDKLIEAFIGKQENLTEAGIQKKLLEYENSLNTLKEELRSQNRPDIIKSINENFENLKKQMTKVTKNTATDLVLEFTEPLNSVQYEILKILSNAENAVGLSYLSKLLKASKIAIYNSIKELVNRGLIEERKFTATDYGYWINDYGRKIIKPLLINYCIATFTVNSNKYTINGKNKEMGNVKPLIKNDRTYVPVRFVALALGYLENNIIWNSDEQSLIIIGGDRVVKFIIGSSIITINGVQFAIDAPPELISGEVMLSVRGVALALGADTSWDPGSFTVTFQ